MKDQFPGLHFPPKTCFIIITCFDQLYQLQLVKPSWGKQNSGFAVPQSILHASTVSLSVSLVETNCFLYNRKQPHSWSTVTLWLIFPAIQFIIIVINYHPVPRWPTLMCPLWISMQWWRTKSFRNMTDIYVKMCCLFPLLYYLFSTFFWALECSTYSHASWSL